MIDSVSVYQLGSSTTIGLGILNGSYNTPVGFCCQYEVYINNFNEQGGDKAIYISGWQEGVHIINPALDGLNYGIYYDAAGAIAAGTGTPVPVFHVQGGEFNATHNNILLNGVAAINISGGDFYKGVGTGDVDTAGILITNASEVQIIGNKFSGSFNSALGSAMSAEVDNSSKVVFSNNVVDITSNGWAGVIFNANNDVSIADNMIKTVGTSTATNGVYAVNGAVLGVTNNMIHGWAATVGSAGSCINTTASTSVFGASVATNGCF